MERTFINAKTGDGKAALFAAAGKMVTRYTVMSMAGVIQNAKAN